MQLLALELLIHCWTGFDMHRKKDQHPCCGTHTSRGFKMKMV